MVRERLRRVDERGFTLAELMIVMVMIGLLTLVGAPTLINYWQTATLQAGAQELASVASYGRQYAIAKNTSACVIVSGTGVRFETVNAGACTGTAISLPNTGTSAILLTNGLQVTGSTSVIFTNLGAASTAGTFTVTHPVTSKTRSVVVAASGQVRVQ
jgi:prepilin-type N-terminal cleavage/methylation domain-containing protein